MSMIPCTEPLRLSALIDYWLGDLASEAEERVEEHFLGCAWCSELLSHLVTLAGGVRALAREGLVCAVVTSAFLESVMAGGFAVREYRLVPGSSVQCTVS